MFKWLGAIHKSAGGISDWLPIVGPGGFVWIGMTWVAHQLPQLTEYGWSGAIIFAAILTCALLFAFSAALTAWRIFHPLSDAGIPPHPAGSLPYPAPHPPVKAPKDLSKIPTPAVLDLYMSDFAGKGSGGGVAIQIMAVNDITLPNVAIRVPFTVVADTGSLAKFMILFVPANARTYEILEHIAQVYKTFFDLNIEGIDQGQGQTSATTMKETIFTGRLFIYHETLLSLGQLAALHDLYARNGANVSFRGSSHALAVWSSIRSGDIKSPARYRLEDGIPRLVG